MSGDAERTVLSPDANPELLGHEAAEHQFVKGFRAGRLHHAWLLTGPPGIGKATFAYRAARWLLAGGPASGAAGTLYLDPGHPVFRMVASRGHPDFRVLERATNETTGKLKQSIAVDQVRKALDFLQLTPARGGWRVVVVDAVEDLNANSANALLKSLEEPPPRGLFLLVNHAVSQALPTIRSRCQRLVLQPLDDGAVAAILQRAAPDLDGAAVAELARLAEGSPGRALAIAEAGGLDLLHEMQGVLGRLPALDLAALDRHAEKVARAGDEAFGVLRDLLLWWISARAKGDAAQPAAARAGAGLDRWARLWENTRRLFERAEAATLDRKQALLEIFYDIQATARGA